MSTLSPSFERKIPDGDDHERLVCQHCDFINYENPKIVVGSVVTDQDDRVLICKRAIDPQKGLWTIPAGFMELGETPAEGAAREAMEEACAAIEIRDMLAVYTIKHISQVQIMFRARLVKPEIAAGPESLDVDLVKWDKIPWKELAFPSVHWALRQFDTARNLTSFAPFGNPAGY